MSGAFWVRPHLLLSSLVFVAVAVSSFAQGTPSSAAPAAASLHDRLRVSEASTSQLILKKVPPKYPEASAKAGIQGVVVLKVVVDATGAIKEVTTVSGDPGLAAAAIEAVRQWKYQPYVMDGLAIEIETQATLNFQLAGQQAAAPTPQGLFRDDTYTNEYFELSYPLSREWVRVTDITRKRMAAENQANAASLLLSVVHIPQDLTELRADSSFSLLAVPRSPHMSTETCRQYLDTLQSAMAAGKSAKQKGETSEFTAAGRDFMRADFEYRSGPADHAVICSPAKDYLLLWDIQGLSRKDVNLATSTLNAIGTWIPLVKPTTPETPSNPKQVKISQGASIGLRIKNVAPSYPPFARHHGIQGTVVLRAVISKTGDVEDLELIDGPIELAISAVTAVRQWKYRPYLLIGEPVEVQTEIVVNYRLSG